MGMNDEVRRGIDAEFSFAMKIFFDICILLYTGCCSCVTSLRSLRAKYQYKCYGTSLIILKI